MAVPNADRYGFYRRQMKYAPLTARQERRLNKKRNRDLKNLREVLMPSSEKE